MTAKRGTTRFWKRGMAKWAVVFLAVALVAAACGDDGGDPARVTDVLNPSGTPGASASPSASATPHGSATPYASATPHGSATPYASATPYGSATPTVHATATATHTPTAAATPTATPVATPTASMTPTAAAPSGAASDDQAAMDAWAVVFDSTVEFSEKAPHLEDAAALESSNAAYAASGEGLGGVSLEPTAVEINGDQATITYNVLFGGTPAYTDLTGEIQRVDGTWTVSREVYCGFLASARTPCS